VTRLRRIVLLGTLALAALLVGAVALAGAARSAVPTGIVEIQTRLAYANGVGAATGLVLTPSGEVLTNNHVIRGATQIRVHVPHTDRSYSARVLGYDVSADVALLKLDGASGLRTVSLGNSSTVRVGQEITAIGNAGGEGISARTGTVTALGRTITVGDEQGGAARLTRLIKTDADLRPGDSGGALLDGNSRVIGMNAAASAELVYRHNGGDGYAIPVNRATSIASQIEARRSSANVHIGATPFLGVTVDTRPGNTVAGVFVTSVRPGSPASRAGLVAGDVLVAVGGHTVRTHSGLVAVLLRKHPGDRISVAWMDRGGNRDAATVTLASGPPQ
jgi:S1-C subfamily serine protease